EDRARFVKRLMDKGLAWQSPHNRDVGTSWLNRLMSARLADWACRTARAVVLEVLHHIPDGPMDTSRMFKDDFRDRAELWIDKGPLLVPVPATPPRGMPPVAVFGVGALAGAMLMAALSVWLA